MASTMIQDNFTVQFDWEPYMLSPGTPDEGYDLMEYLVRKYGEGARKNFGDPSSPLNSSAAELGFQFNTGRRIVNSLLAHRLVEFAKRQEKGNVMMLALFREYFENAVDISKKPILVQIAARCELDTDEVANFLDTDEFKYEVISANDSFKRYVSGVPYILVSSSIQAENDKPLLLRGAPSEELLEELTKYLAKL